MAPCECENTYQYYSCQWTYGTCLHSFLITDEGFTVQYTVDIALHFWDLLLQVLLDIIALYADLQHCGALYGIVKSSDLQLVANIGTK